MASRVAPVDRCPRTILPLSYAGPLGSPLKRASPWPRERRAQGCQGAKSDATEFLSPSEWSSFLESLDLFSFRINWVRHLPATQSIVTFTTHLHSKSQFENICTVKIFSYLKYRPQADWSAISFYYLPHILVCASFAPPRFGPVSPPRLRFQ